MLLFPRIRERTPPRYARASLAVKVPAERLPCVRLLFSRPDELVWAGYSLEVAWDGIFPKPASESYASDRSISADVSISSFAKLRRGFRKDKRVEASKL